MSHFHTFDNTKQEQGREHKAREQSSMAGSTRQGSRAAGQGSKASGQGSKSGQHSKFKLQTAAERQTFVKSCVDFLMTFQAFAKNNLQTSAHGQRLVKRDVNSLVSDHWRCQVVNGRTEATCFQTLC